MIVKKRKCFMLLVFERFVELLPTLNPKTGIYLLRFYKPSQNGRCIEHDPRTNLHERSCDFKPRVQSALAVLFFSLAGEYFAISTITARKIPDSRPRPTRVRHCTVDIRIHTYSNRIKRFTFIWQTNNEWRIQPSSRISQIGQGNYIPSATIHRFHHGVIDT